MDHITHTPKEVPKHPRNTMSDAPIITSQTPETFLCPLTLDVMDDPVQHKVTKRNYERGAILHWIYFGNATCPFTREPLDPSDFEDNQELQREINAWRSEETKSSVSYPELVPPEEVPKEPTAPKKKATKKERALLRKLEKLRRRRSQAEASCQCSSKGQC